MIYDYNKTIEKVHFLDWQFYVWPSKSISTLLNQEDEKCIRNRVSETAASTRVSETAARHNINIASLAVRSFIF